MKLRLHHQELRFRLSPRDIAQLETTETLKDQLELSPQVSWQYQICLEARDESAVQAESPSNSVSVLVPRAPFRAWLQSPEIEWIFTQPDPTLTVYIEKDLKPHRS